MPAACVGAHHLSRRLSLRGHDARLMPAKYVRPYAKGQKNDFCDADAIADDEVRSHEDRRSTGPAGAAPVRERLVSQRTGIER
jgi:transposase